MPPSVHARYMNFHPFFLSFFVSHAKISTGSNARFRQERTMGKASQWFVFPSDRRGKGGGAVFLLW